MYYPKADMTGYVVSSWDSWQDYATAAKLGDKDQEILAATSLSIMGNEWLLVCRNLVMTTEESQNADVILTKLNKYFIPQRNKIYERYVFDSRCQKADESFDKFVDSAWQTRRYM